MFFLSSFLICRLSFFLSFLPFLSAGLLCRRLSFFLHVCLSLFLSFCVLSYSLVISLSLSLFLVSFHPLLRVPFLSDVLPWRGDGPCNPRVRPLQQRNAKKTKHRKTKQPRNKLTVWNCSHRAQDTRTCRATAKPTKVTAAVTTARSPHNGHNSLSCPVEPRQCWCEPRAKLLRRFGYSFPPREASLLTPRKPTSARCVDPWRVASAHCEGDHMGAPPMPPPPLDCQLPPLNFASD